MKQYAILGIGILLVVLSACTSSTTLQSDTPKSCSNCQQWNQPQAPFRIYGNTWYVGTSGLSSILIASSNGLVLIDGGLSQSAPLIAANIRELGFELTDIAVILNSHAHYDHAGGLAALQRASRAPVLVTTASAEALQLGGVTAADPQFGFGVAANAFPEVRTIEIITDGAQIQQGDVTLTAHTTPGHTQGSTSWSWVSCEADRCLDIVYADSISAVSAPEFRFTGNHTGIDYVSDFESTFITISQLDCDVLLSPHPFYFDMAEKLERRQSGYADNPFIDSAACRKYADTARDLWQQRLLQEAASGAAE